MADHSMPSQKDIATDPAAEVQIQPCGFLLELSSDWLILRASENVHRFLSEYHARLIGEHLSSFTRAQPLHDLRNLLTRQRASDGIARAYRVRLIDDPRHFDFAFQQHGGRMLLEGVPSPDEGFGVWMGSVSRLIDGLADNEGQRRLDDAARRMRALGGFDRVVLTLVSGESAESSRGGPGDGEAPPADLPPIVADLDHSPISLFPRDRGNSAAGEALLRAPMPEQASRLRNRSVQSLLRLPLRTGGQTIGEFFCEGRSSRPANLELHAAAELFAQILSMTMGERRD